MFRRGAAAAADDIHEALARPVGYFRRQLFRCFVVAAEGIRQTGIRVRRDEAIAALREFFDILPQFTGALGAALIAASLLWYFAADRLTPHTT